MSDYKLVYLAWEFGVIWSHLEMRVLKLLHKIYKGVFGAGFDGGGGVCQLYII